MNSRRYIISLLKNHKKLWYFRNFVIVGNERGNKSIHIFI